jgi:hypothetical protein
MEEGDHASLIQACDHTGDRTKCEKGTEFQW